MQSEQEMRTILCLMNIKRKSCNKPEIILKELQRSLGMHSLYFACISNKLSILFSVFSYIKFLCNSNFEPTHLSLCLLATWLSGQDQGHSTHMVSLDTTILSPPPNTTLAARLSP